jgi:peptidoglycan LD-endopeptidase LytH
VLLRRPAAAALLAVALLPLTPSGATAESSADVKRQLEALTTRVHDAEARQAEITDRLTKLDRQLAQTGVQVVAARARLAGRVRTAYIHGMGASDISVLLASEDPTASLERVSLYDAATRGDRETLREIRVLSRKQQQARAALDQAEDEIDAVRRKLRRDAARLAQLFDVLARQEAEAERRRVAAAEAARQARIREAKARTARERAEARRRAAERARRAARASRSSAFSSGGKYCPVGPVHSFSDTWGAPRSGGRRHQGTDIFAPHGSPAYAVVSGTVKTGYNRLGGIVLYLKGDDGDTYYYAHNSANIASNGERVAAGELIARVGKTGNAQGTSPHVHFERHPGGGSAVNPYPFLRAVCG